MTEAGAGPPSAARLGSQKARSHRGFPTHAQFKSISSARPSRRQRLSLRTSQCRRDAPAAVAPAVASANVGRTSSSHPAPQRPSARNGAGSRATSRHAWRNRASCRSAPGTSGGGGAAWTSSRQASTASTPVRSHGGGHDASERSSIASTGRSPSSEKPAMRGRNGRPRSWVYIRCSSRTHAAVSRVAPILTNARAPSGSVTIHRAAAVCPRAGPVATPPTRPSAPPQRGRHPALPAASPAASLAGPWAPSVSGAPAGVSGR